MNPKRPIPGRTMSATMPQHATAGAWHTKTLNAWCKERTCWNLRRICHTASPLPQANKTRPSFMIFMGCRGDRISILFLWNCTMRNIIRLIHCNIYVCIYTLVHYCTVYYIGLSGQRSRWSRDNPVDPRAARMVNVNITGLAPASTFKPLPSPKLEKKWRSSLK